jgi:hypothetical protein
MINISLGKLIREYRIWLFVCNRLYEISIIE